KGDYAMTDPRLKKELSPSALALFVKGITVEDFGRKVICHMIVETKTEPDEFQIILSDCTDLTWEVFVDSFEPVGVPLLYGADVIGIELGEEAYQKRFEVLTDLFELLAEYRQLEIVHNGRYQEVFAG
ncbi:MAG TPA: hypothetical protein VHL11_16900, partial [Phototrophicaceae bacterium]|nr:hypothetical protein [Phototrophicaceae bacterium]